MLIGSLVGLLIAIIISAMTITRIIKFAEIQAKLGYKSNITWNYPIMALLLMFYTAIGALIGAIFEG
jgi:uncharacterized membrane protein